MSAQSKYPHTQVTSEPHTPLYLKLYTVLIMLRYGVRAGLRDITSDTPNWVVNKLHLSIKPEHGSIANRIADTIVGVLSLGVTTLHMLRTRRDIKNVYSEAVGLELNKNPSQVTWSDLRHSENVLVKNALKRFGWFNVMRYGTDLIFFSSAAEKTPEGGIGIDRGMFAKGLTLGYEIIRQPSFFEILQRQVADKFGTSGLGNDITAHELKELYNAYAQTHDAGSMIRATDVERWNNNEAMFKRIAYLINHSYRERRVPFESADPRVPGRLVIQKQENFRLPVLLHMLGNGFFDLEKTDQTRTYIEIANRYGVKVLSEARQQIERGVTLAEIHEKYDIVLPSYIIQHGLRPAVEEVGKAPDVPPMTPAATEQPSTSMVERIGAGNAAATAVDRVQAKAAAAAAGIPRGV